MLEGDGESIRSGESPELYFHRFKLLPYMVEVDTPDEALPSSALTEVSSEEWERIRDRKPATLPFDLADLA